MAKGTAPGGGNGLYGPGGGAPMSPQDRAKALASGAIQTDPNGRGGKLTLGQQLLKDQQTGRNMMLPMASGPTTTVTPGGGNQNAFSPQPATVTTTPARAQFAAMMV